MRLHVWSKACLVISFYVVDSSYGCGFMGHMFCTRLNTNLDGIVDVVANFQIRELIVHFKSLGGHCNLDKRFRWKSVIYP